MSSSSESQSGEGSASDPVDQTVPPAPVDLWRKRLHEEQSFGPKDLIDFFKQATPPLFLLECARNPADLGKNLFDEARAKALIIRPLEELVWGCDPDAALERLKATEHTPSVCGRVFKNGEPTYNCRECGMDPTCVLCVQCFKQSSHRYHKYKMSTSQGGGCCDCGDPEAWKRDAYCESHQAGLEKAKSETATGQGLPADVLSAAAVVQEAVLDFAAYALEIDSNATLVDSDEDVYCTVLYNDETHVLEQVIQNLQKTIKCTPRDALDYVTRIDHEGRAMVKCSTFDVCQRLKLEVEKHSMRSVMQQKGQPLRVAILHKKAIAYQQFALQALGWLQAFLMHHPDLRAVFKDLVTAPANAAFNIKHILLNDHRLWKTARLAWHKLLIAGMLMEYENKKRFATIFTQTYASILQDFVRDDHDHQYSVASLSVQLFTVPTVVHYLIAEESALFQLMHTFYAECVEKYVDGNVLTFVKNPSNVNAFKRAVVILSDVKYLLHVKPDRWTDELRKGFLHGVQILVKLLWVMQGMDAVHRQTGSHIDYEPEWESAFNLHIRLERVISLVLDWCSTDKVVLVKVYRMVMAQLAESTFIVGQARREVQELANHSASCLMYDVSVKYVSIHLPLTRFFAGLYLQLEAFHLTYDTVSVKTQKKASPEEIIEPVLCTQTMIAQVHAGMWRRNGYSLLNQLYFYANVKCRSEMLDRDVVVLQIGASLIESNEFLIHAVSKFGLINWVNVQHEEEDANNVGTVVNMVDELLELLIVVVGERFVPGLGCVTAEDCVRKELVQQLCIKPFSHSELSKALPDVPPVHETDVMERVIEQIATFKKPQLSDKKGVYELRPEFYGMYNMYYYHYSKEDKSKSEEAQRRRQNDKNACCPPPQLPKLTESFSMLANLLQCDVMFQLMSTVMRRACDLKAGLFAESHLQKVLYLIGYGLQEEETGHYPFLTFYERAVKWKIPDLLQELQKSPRVETQASFIQWVLDKFEAMKPKERTATEAEEQQQQQAMDTTEQQSGSGKTADTEAAELREKKRLAAERQAKIMAQMMNAQKKFMSVHAEHFAEDADADKDEERMDWAEARDAEVDEASISCLGPRRQLYVEEDVRETCILCSESALVNGSDTAQHLVYSCFVQKSNVIYGPQAQWDYPYVSSCGHVMHAACWQEYYKNERMKENRRPHRQRSPGSFDIDKREFLCPLCRCLSNTVMPLNQSLPKISVANGGPKERLPIGMEFGVWLEEMRRGDVFRKPLREVFKADAERRAAFEALSPPVQRRLLPAMRELMRGFEEPLTTMELGPTFTRQVWRALMYTLQATEMVLRATHKPLRGHLSIRQSNCLSGLVRVCGLLAASHHGLPGDGEWSDVFSLYSNADSLLRTNVFERLVVTLFLVPAVIYHEQKKVVAAGWTVPRLVEGSSSSSSGGSNSGAGGAGRTDEPMQDVNRNAAPQNVDESVSHEDSAECSMDDSGEQQQAEECTAGEASPEGVCGMATGQAMDFYNLRLAFELNMIKILIVYEPPQDQEAPPEDVDMMQTSSSGSGGELPNLLAFFQHHNLFSGTTRRTITSRELVAEVRSKSETFLRSSCLLFHFLTGVQMPEEFESVGGDSFELMCEYLGLSANLESYFQCEQTLQFVTQRAMHQEICDLRKAVQRQRAAEAEQAAEGASVGAMEIQRRLAKIEPSWWPVRQLVELPEDYSDLINSVSLFTCPNSNLDDSRNPTMCLVCGQVLCSQTYCCRFETARSTVGACTFHAMTCNNEVAPFLRIRDCDLMLLGINKGCYIQPPYLDEYGETDQGLRRGNPLTLCRERYGRLHLLWLSHSLHEEISRAIETANTIGATQWQYL